MLFYLLLLFTIVPLVELMILIRIGQLSAAWVPFAIVIVTGILGAGLARWQGWQALQRIREEARAGHIPAAALIDGFLILVAGIVLVTPGVLTDILGIALLIPPMRTFVKRGVVAWLTRHVQTRVTRAAAAYERRSENLAPGRDEIIDVTVVNTQVEDAPPRS